MNVYASGTFFSFHQEIAKALLCPTYIDKSEIGLNLLLLWYLLPHFHREKLNKS